MKITITFDSMEEFLRYTRTEREGFAEPLSGHTAAPWPESGELTSEEPKEAPAAAQEATAPAATVPDRAEVRKVLAKVNKATGRNRAAEIIKEVTGCAKLSDVPDDELAAVLAEAEAAFNG